MKAWFAAVALLLAAPLAAQPQDITREGTVAHRAARTGFPETVGNFRRLAVTRYDSAGLDLSANYQLIRPEGQVRATIYIYPAGGAPTAPSARAQFCREHFEGVEGSILQTYRNADRIDEAGPAPARGGVDPGLAYRSSFRFPADIGRGAEPLVSEARLYCFVDGDWLVKYRISASAGMDARAAIESFVGLGPWPGQAPGEIALR
jgi:hypothetical protein